MELKNVLYIYVNRKIIVKSMLLIVLECPIQHTSNMNMENVILE